MFLLSLGVANKSTDELLLQLRHLSVQMDADVRLHVLGAVVQDLEQ